MGTTASIFDDDDTENVPHPPSPPPQEQVRPRRRRPAVEDDQQPRPRRKPQSEGRQQQRPRRSVPPHHPVAADVFSLSGAIAGLPTSGKRTLLRRLTGKMDLNNDEQPERTAVIPFQPRSMQVWDSRIQLRVETVSSAADFPASSVDFVVFLIDPSKPREEVKGCLEDTLEAVLRRNGYLDREQQQVDADETQANQSTSRRKGVCFCALLNFCDKKEESGTWLELSDVQTWVKEFLRDFSEEESSCLVFDCIETCMMNFYGLVSLHHFIYKSYLLRKRLQLEEQLEKVHQAQSSQPPTRPSYEDHLRMLQVQQQPSRRPRPRDERHKEEEEQQQPAGEASEQEERTSTRSRRKVTFQTSTTTDSAAPEPKQEEEPTRRRLAPERRHQVTPAPSASSVPADPRAALDAFFGSDSEDEDINAATPVAAASKPATANDSDSDDEDEGFFYDEAGLHRAELPRVMAPPQTVNRNQRAITSSQATPDVDSTCSSPAVKQAHAQKRPKQSESVSPIPAPIVSSHRLPNQDNADSDDDEFFVGASSSTPTKASTAPSTTSVAKPASSANVWAKPSSGLSAEARAAVLQAQQEAERMLFQPLEQQVGGTALQPTDGRLGAEGKHKKTKSKKDKKEKRKKKSGS